MPKFAAPLPAPTPTNTATPPSNGVPVPPKRAQNGFIRVQGARVHNLKNVSVDIPRGKLVVVTLNYRLNLFGFLSHPALNNGGGNFGLMDMQAALRWVQRNAAA